ncbi:MAG TPA: AMP-binding protein, partial [Baekduia sp.]|nr:AMP-binding protein [Baekduia sp.]
MSDENLYTMFHRATEAFPEQAAVVFEGRSLTYAALDRLVLSVATGLADLGVQPGDRVVFYAPNSPELLATYFACAYLGAVFAPVNPVFRAREMHYICENAEARVSIIHRDKLEDFEAFESAAQRAESTVVLDELDAPSVRDDGRRSFATLTAEARPPGQHETAPEDPVLICYTSGTTSTPKPVLLS